MAPAASGLGQIVSPLGLIEHPEVAAFTANAEFSKQVVVNGLVTLRPGQGPTSSKPLRPITRRLVSAEVLIENGGCDSRRIFRPS